MEKNQSTQSSELSFLGARIIFYSFIISPIFFIPCVYLGLSYAKGLLLTLGAFLGIAIYFIDALKTGHFVVPKGKSSLAIGLLVVVSFISTLFVPFPQGSFIGSGFDSGTVAMLLVLFIYYFLLSTWSDFLPNPKKISKYILGFGFVVILFQIAQMFFSPISRFPKVFIGLSNGNLIGSWNDFALYLGIIIIVGLLYIEKNNKNIKSILLPSIIIILSVLFLFIINFNFVWILLGLFALCMFVYRLANNYNHKNSRFPVLYFIIIVLSFVTILGSAKISSIIAGKPFNFVNNEARPSLSATVSVVKNVYHTNPLTGIGPARFGQAWELARPRIFSNQASFNSPFWSTSFTGGFSFIANFFVTLGILGAICVLFLLFVLFKGIYGLFKLLEKEKVENNSLLFISIGLYSLLSVFIFLPGSFMTIFLFGLIALSVSSIYQFNEIPSVYSLSFVHDTRHSFFSILGILLALALCIVGAYSAFAAFYSLNLANRAVSISGDKNQLNNVTNLLSRSFNATHNDLYQRALSDASLLKVKSLMNNTTLSQDQIRTNIKDEFANASKYAQNAITLDPKNKDNYIALLKVEEAFISLGALDVYDSAIGTIDKILTLSPNNPSFIFRKAQIAYSANKIADAKIFLGEALKINPYYKDAFLAQQSMEKQNNTPAKEIAPTGKDLKTKSQ